MSSTIEHVGRIACSESGHSGSPPAKPSILMVDDHPARLLTYEAILAGLPLNFVRARSGEEALHLLLQQSFALILLDVNMPGIDGFEVARHVRAHPRLGTMPIIFVSGERLSDLDRLKGYEVGAIDYIHLPIVPEILRSKVALLLELSHRRTELSELSRATADARSQSAGEPEQGGASPTQLRALFEQTTDIQLIVKGEPDADGNLTIWRYVDVNASALALYQRTREQVVGKTVHEAFPGHAARAGVLCQRALLKGERLQHETEFNGRHLLVRMFAVDSQSVAVVCTDITDRKRVESALASSERRFQALLENCPVGVAQNDIDGRFLYVNAGFCSMVGYTPGELSNMTWQQITHPDDLLADQSRAALVMAGKLPHYTIEKRYIRKDGTAVWVSMFGNFIYDEEHRPIQGVAVIVDITARMQADLALHEGRQRLQLAHDAAGLGSFDWNVRDDRATWDARARGLWGFPSDKPVSLSAVLAGIHQDDRPRVAAAIERALRAETGGRYRAAYRVVHQQDGQTRWVESHGQVQFENGLPVRMVGIKQDITAQRELQEALTEADRRKDEFLAMLAHELRNPVAPIMSVAELLSHRAIRDPELGRQVEIIRRQAAHLGRLLDDLLDVARITRDRITLRREVFDLADAVATALETVGPALRAGEHALELTSFAGAMCVDADRVRLTQCVVNLLDNAVKFSPPGKPIQVRTGIRHGSAVLEVRDFGRGIRADFLPRVFDLFAQADRSLDRKAGGLGVGLPVCKRLIEMHGGTVTAASDGEGLGATFTLSLPLAASSSQAAERPAAIETQPRRILVVDDNRDAADSIALLLQLSGHATLVAYEGRRALGQWRDFGPDTVLLDIGLPDLDGFEVIRQMRAAGFSGYAMALTGYGQPEDHRKAREAGFDVHLVKPVAHEALEAALAGANRGSA